MLDPLSKPKESFHDLIAQISAQDSPVGIDAKYTHAVIIDFLRQISKRLESLEMLVREKNRND
jgi:hypothetical protein